uniref:Uncharacterized protein n=1 Tax=Rhizophora mucronata TaxID=61149 RepID=A0A2P2N536_RHIMU
MGAQVIPWRQSGWPSFPSQRPRNIFSTPTTQTPERGRPLLLLLLLLLSLKLLFVVSQ